MRYFSQMIDSSPKKILYISLFLLAFLGDNCLGQSPYILNKSKEIPLIGIGSISLGTSLILRGQVDLLTEEAINGLDRNIINTFDRNASFNASTLAAKQSDVFLYGSSALPIFLMASSQIKSDVFTIAALWGETVLMNGGLTLLSKYSSQRLRPFVYNPDFSLEDKLDLNAKTSFFSGHSSMVAASTFFAAKVFTDYYPHNRWRWLVWSLASIIPMTTAYLRVAAGKHFPTDVITGCLMGAACGFFIPEIHKKERKKDNEIVFFVTSQKMTILYNF